MSVIRHFISECQCGKSIGLRQCKYEDAIIEGTPINDILINFGWGKMCCRCQIINAPTLLLLDTNSNAFVVECDNDDESCESTSVSRVIVKPKKNPPNYPALPA